MSGRTIVSPMKFDLIDKVVERSEDRLVTIKCVTAAEEYLADHFPGWPVLPGVLMVEALTQAGRELVRERAGRLVLGRVRAMKFGRFVRPGDTMVVVVRLVGESNGEYDFRGDATVAGDSDRSAVSGRFTLRPMRTG